MSKEDTISDIKKGLAALEAATEKALDHMPAGQVEVMKAAAQPSQQGNFVLSNQKIDTSRIRELAQSGKREELLEFLTSTIESLEHDKENAYSVATRILQSGGYALDPFTLAALAKFAECAGSSSKEVTRVVKMVADIVLQWTIIDMKKDESDEGYAEFTQEDGDPLSDGEQK